MCFIKAHRLVCNMTYLGIRPVRPRHIKEVLYDPLLLIEVARSLSLIGLSSRSISAESAGVGIIPLLRHARKGAWLIDRTLARVKSRQILKLAGVHGRLWVHADSAGQRVLQDAYVKFSD